MISVVIPSFNSSLFIQRAIESVIDDSLVQEVIVVDDGSTDNTRELVTDLMEYFPKLMLLHHEGFQNKGACASRNVGLYQAKAEWIQFLDSDDEIIPGKFERQLNIVSNKQCDLILGAYEFVKGNSSKIFEPEKKDFWLGFNQYLLGHTNSNLWNRNSLISIGGWKESWPSNQDYEILLRALCNNFKIEIDNIPSSRYIKRSNSISTLGKNKGWQTQVLLRLDMCDYLYSNHIFTFKRAFYIHRFIYKKLIMIRRAPELKCDSDELNNRFFSSPWFSSIILFLSAPKYLFYTLLGFEYTERLIKTIRR